MRRQLEEKEEEKNTTEKRTEKRGEEKSCFVPPAPKKEPDSGSGEDARGPGAIRVSGTDGQRRAFRLPLRTCRQVWARTKGAMNVDTS